MTRDLLAVFAPENAGNSEATGAPWATGAANPPETVLKGPFEAVAHRRAGRATWAILAEQLPLRGGVAQVAQQPADWATDRSRRNVKETLEIGTTVAPIAPVAHDDGLGSIGAPNKPWRLPLVEKLCRSVPREWADGFGRMVTDGRPIGVSPAVWDRLIDAGGDLLLHWGAALAALGWQTGDLFGASHEAPLVRLDRAGLVLLLVRRRVIDATPNVVILQTKTGARQSFTRRRPADPDRVPIWDLPVAGRYRHLAEENLNLEEHCS
ncbi:hypothetical protein [Rhodospirillaceae bacterium SYSU D60014]|uniref:hypothetical protein n=1 Tax=Virgifigura deserti TaxID=2268457 RepID=UPI0013C4F324